MNKKPIFKILYISLLIAVAILSYMRGRHDVLVGEFKIYEADLIDVRFYGNRYSDDLKEFMKGRYYYLANRVPEGWLGSPYDYGMVSTNVAHLGIGKGPTSPQHEYDQFKQKNVTFRSPMK